MPTPHKTEKKKLDASKGSKKWEPKTEAERSMDPKYRAWSRQRRMAAGVDLVLEDGLSVSEAARTVGVSRPRLSNNVKEGRERRQELKDRAQKARSEAVAEYQNSGQPDNVQKSGSSDSEIITAKRRVPESLYEFNEHYFSNEECPDCMKHHETPDFHIDAMNLMDDRSKRLKLINFAPYHAKSTICTFKSTLFALVRDPSSRTAIISAGRDLAEAMLYQIKEHLTDPDLYIGAKGNLIEDFGPFHNPGHWSNDNIYIYGRSGAQKDPSVSVYGFGSKIYGRRFDRMLFDDVADLENQNTPESIAKMYRKIWQEYTNRVGKTGEIAWIGTRVMAGDVYSLLDDVDGMNVLRRPCIIDEETGVTLWPDHYPIETAIMQRNAMAPDQFQLVYQNVESPGTGASFPIEVLERSHDPERFAGHTEPSWALVIGLDPAGANAQSGYTAMVALAVDLESGRRYLVDTVRQKQLKAPQTLAQIYDWVERYPQVRELRVEVNGLQSQIYQYSEELNRKLTQKGVRIQPHITHKGNKFDPQFGVEAMSALYHNGMVSTPWGDLQSREKFKALENELMQFPMGTTSDLVMALWFAELGCKDLLQRQALPGFDARQRVPARIARNRRVLNFGNRSARAAGPADMVGGLHGPAPLPERAQFVNVAAGVDLAG